MGKEYYIPEGMEAKFDANGSLLSVEVEGVTFAFRKSDDGTLITNHYDVYSDSDCNRTKRDNKGRLVYINKVSPQIPSISYSYNDDKLDKITVLCNNGESDAEVEIKVEYVGNNIVALHSQNPDIYPSYEFTYEDTKLVGIKTTDITWTMRYEDRTMFVNRIDDTADATYEYNVSDYDFIKLLNTLGVVDCTQVLAPTVSMDDVYLVRYSDTRYCHSGMKVVRIYRDKGTLSEIIYQDGKVVTINEYCNYLKVSSKHLDTGIESTEGYEGNMYITTTTDINTGNQDIYEYIIERFDVGDTKETLYRHTQIKMYEDKEVTVKTTYPVANLIKTIETETVYKDGSPSVKLTEKYFYDKYTEAIVGYENNTGFKWSI